MFSSESRAFLPSLLPFLLVVAVAGCRNDGDADKAAHDVPEPRLICHMPLNERSEVVADDPDLVMDDFEPHEGAASLHIFATDLRLTWVWEGEPGGMQGDRIAVTGWARTHVMQRAVSLKLVVTPAEGDPLVITRLLDDVRRTTPWARFRAEFPIPVGFDPVRLKLGVQIPYPGKLWLDDVSIWDEVRAE